VSTGDRTARDEFLAGERNSLSGADGDPVGTQLYANYCAAMEQKANRDLGAAAALLELSVTPPSEYHAHYEELFKIWREWNRRDAKVARHFEVLVRVRRMIRLDDEMVGFMLHRARRFDPIPSNCDGYRNLKVTDLKLFAKAAVGLGDAVAEQESTEAMAIFSARRAVIGLRRTCSFCGLTVRGAAATCPYCARSMPEPVR
jgi:hypothetical protein